jgi:hypothetical protein
VLGWRPRAGHPAWGEVLTTKAILKGALSHASVPRAPQSVSLILIFDTDRPAKQVLLEQLPRHDARPMERVNRKPTPRLPRLCRNGNVKTSDTRSPRETSLETVKRTFSTSLRSHACSFSRNGQAIRDPCWGRSDQYQHSLEPLKSSSNANGHRGHGGLHSTTSGVSDQYLAAKGIVIGLVLWFWTLGDEGRFVGQGP